MTKNKKYFALFPFIISIALNFRFPDTNPYGEEVVSILNIPVQTVNGINYSGMASLLFLIISLYILVKSLEKYHVRFVSIAILIEYLLLLSLLVHFKKRLLREFM